MPGINPILQQKIDRLFEIAKTPYNYNLRITSGYRTPEEQQALYEQGRTKPGNIVTNARGLPICESDHCKGLAVDVVDSKNGYNINWPLLAQLAKSVGLKWGGDWKQFPDKPHFYIDQPIINQGKIMFEKVHNYVKTKLEGILQNKAGAPTVYRVKIDNKERAIVRKFSDTDYRIRRNVGFEEWVMASDFTAPVSAEDVKDMAIF